MLHVGMETESLQTLLMFTKMMYITYEIILQVITFKIFYDLKSHKTINNRSLYKT